MADNVQVTAGSGTTIACDEVVDATLGTVKVQYVKLMDGTLDSTTKAAVDAVGLAVGGTGIGSLTETAPGTDTASSGLNGRLQRIAQRLTSMIALLPAALGTGGGLKVDGSGTALPVSGSGNFASTVADGANTTLGAKADAKSAATDTTAISIMSVLKQVSAYLGGTLTVASHAVTNAGTFAVQATEADGANTTLGAKADAKNAATDTTAISIMSVLKQVSAYLGAALAVTQSGNWTARVVGNAGATVDATIGAGTAPTNVVVVGGQYNTSLPAPTTGQTMGLQLDASGRQIISGTYGLTNKLFSAAFSTLTRPANVTAYSAGDSISDNATPASVTALSATVSDVNNDPVFLSEILVNSTDTGLAGKRIRAYLFNSDPTASTGVVNGDNSAYSQKKAGYIGSMSGIMETGFSDGTVGRLVPAFNDGVATGQSASANSYIVTVPTSAARTLYIQYQAIDAFTPSANSTTIIGTARGWQGRAA